MALFALFAFPLSPLQAADGTYTSTSGGAWNVAGSWASSAIASGSGSTAYFDTLDLTTNLSLSLGADRTIGNLIFGDTAPSNHGWTITGNTLTLAGTTPTVTVNDLGTGTATLNSNIAGTAGLNKAGSGTLVLGGGNSYTGGTTISAGTLISTHISAVRGDVSIASSAVWTVNSVLGTAAVVNGLSGSGSLNGTGTVSVGRNNASSTFDGTIAMTPGFNNFSFIKEGTGTLTLTNTVSVESFFTYQGGWTEVDLSKWGTGFHYFFGGNLRVLGANTAGTAKQMRVNGNATVDTNGYDANFTNLYVYANGFTLTKTGAEAMILHGSQASHTGGPYALAINLQQGTLRSTGSGAYSLGLLTMSAGTIFDLNGVADLTTINRGLNGTGTVTTTGTNRVTFAYGDFAGNIEAGSLYKNQSGTLTLSGTNGYTGSTTVAAGTLVVTGSLTDSSTYSISSGAKLQIGNDTATGTLNGSSIANAGTLEFKRSNALTLNNTITGAGTVTQSGAGTTVLAGANTYTGVTTLSGGTLSVATIGNGGVTGNLGAASNAATNLVFNGGTLQYTGTTAISDRAFTINAGQTATLDVTTHSLSLVGATGAVTNGALTKTGVGTLALTGTSTYTGNTIISAGTLLVNGSLSSASAVQVDVNGTLGGRGSVGAISGAGTVAPGNSPGILTGLSVDGSSGMDFAFEIMASAPNYGDAANSLNDVLRLTAGTPFVIALDGDNTVTVDFSSLSLAIGQTYTGGFYADAGDFAGSISGANFVFEGADGFTIAVSTVQQTADFGSGNINGWVTQFDVLAIPEPSTTLLLTGGLMVIVILRRRSRRA